MAAEPAKKVTLAGPVHKRWLAAFGNEPKSRSGVLLVTTFADLCGVGEAGKIPASPLDGTIIGSIIRLPLIADGGLGCLTEVVKGKQVDPAYKL